METKFQTSFIPKQPITDDAPRHSAGSSLFTLLAFILFMVSIATAGAAFLYNQLLVNTIAKGNTELQRNENAFDPATIQDITRLNDRITAANTLLHNHIAFSNFFGSLEKSTLKNVSFGNFTYTYGGGDKITISMGGLAGRGPVNSYETVALQSKQFTDPSLRNVFKSPILGGLSLNGEGDSGFTFSSALDPTLISYYKLRHDQGPSSSTPDQAPAQQ